MHDLAAVIPKLKSRKKQLAMKKQEEETMGANQSSYKFQNISEIEENSRLLGKKGIRLKVLVCTHEHVLQCTSAVQLISRLKTSLVQAVT